MYPHPASVVLFELDKTLKYKKGPFETRRSELLRLMTLIEGLDKATPRLRVNHNVSWVELRKRIEAATRPVQLDRDEDPVDAVVCAYVALFWYHRPEDVTIYGDYATGYIVTPTLPPDLAPTRTPSRQSRNRTSRNLRERVAQVAALIEEAQRGLSAIRIALDD